MELLAQMENPMYQKELTLHAFNISSIIIVKLYITPRCLKR